MLPLRSAGGRRGRRVVPVVMDALEDRRLLSSTTLTNSNAIEIPVNGAGSLYPAEIVVDGLRDLQSLTVTLNRVNHQFPEDLNFLLQGPGGQTVLLWSDAGGDVDVTDVTITFDDAAPAGRLPDGEAIPSGTYRPTNINRTNDGPLYDVYGAPAPAAEGRYATDLSAFAGTDPNGSWRLYAIDNFDRDVGRVSGGWSLTIHSVDPTTTTLGPVAPASTFGQPVTLVATVTSVAGQTPTGTVSFFDNGELLGTADLDASGRATLTTTAVRAGARRVSAAYDGAGTFVASTSAEVVHQVAPAATLTAVTSSAASAAVGQAVTLVASVTSAAGTPAGIVTFRSGATILGTATLDAGGRAVLEVPNLPVGAHAVTATFDADGDGNHASSASAVMDQTVGYKIAVQSKHAKAVRRGRAVPFAVRLADAAGAFKALPPAQVRVVAVRPAAGSNFAPASTSAALAQQEQQPQPASFKYVKAGRKYVLKLRTKDLAPGPHQLLFVAGDDPTTHVIEFRLK